MFKNIILAAALFTVSVELKAEHIQTDSVATITIEQRLVADIFKAKWDLSDSQSQAVLDKLRIAQNNPTYDGILTKLYHYAAHLNPTPIDQTLWDDSYDALAADDHHKLIAENSKVRILEVLFDPGEVQNYHTHKWAGINVDLIPSDFVVNYLNGEKVLFSATDDPVFMHSEGQKPHAATNTGDIFYVGIHFEVKS